MKDAFQHIIEQYRASIFKICLGYAATPTEAEDLLQEALINIWKGLKSFRQEAQLKTWIYRVTVNTCLLSLRKKRIQTTDLSTVQESHFAKHASSEQKEALEQLHQYIQVLPEKDRVIILLYLEELSHQEIAEVVGISANNVGVRISRVKKRLRGLLRQGFGG
ncbi:MAG: sigma-70 family RNA polymerase sigma factor [Bacteroidota bacterium]